MLLAAGCAKGEEEMPPWDGYDAADIPDLPADIDVEGADVLPETGDPAEDHGGDAADLAPEDGDPPIDVPGEDGSPPDVPEEDLAGDPSPDREDAVDVEDAGIDDAGTDTGPCDPAVWHSYGSTDTPMSIPDSDSSGVTSWIDVTDCDFEVWDVRVTVDIRHGYVGDLLVKLVSPIGRQIVLHNRTGGGTSDIVTTYPVPTDPHETLCRAVRQSSMGRWGLFVSDNAFLDSGTLESWSIELKGTVDGCNPGWWFPSDAFPISIPDNNATGISSTIEVTESGAVTAIRVGVDIGHSYIGDLQVSVTSPGGTTVLLHDRSGGSTSDIRTFYPTPTTPAESMDVYLGAERMGTWTLNVSDHASLDYGDLEGWMLEIN